MLVFMNDNPQINSDQPYSIPDGVRVYAIGDIHGHLAPLQEMHLKIDEHLNANPVDKAYIVYLGDYVDRGPDNMAIIERLSQMPVIEGHIERVFIKGNHEWGMQGFMEQPLIFGAEYLKCGGLDTILSYGVELPDHVTHEAICKREILPAEYERLSSAFNKKVPQHHVEFLNNLDLYRQIGGYVFVHAGIKPGVALEMQNSQDLMRIRHVFSDDARDHGFRVVHGHQIFDDVQITPNRISVDTGFYEKGVLSCVVLEGNNEEIIDVRKEIDQPWTLPNNL